MNAKVTEQDKQTIIGLILQKIQQLNTASAVATFCGVSPSVISQMTKNEYKTQGDTAWINVGTRLGWKPQANNNTWKIVETQDLKDVRKHIKNSKNRTLFLGISDLAGIGKTANLKYVAEEMKQESVFYINCWEWGKKEFLEHLCRNLGIDTGRGYKTPNNLLELVIEFFEQRSIYSPVLIIDEADKLKPNALRCLIQVYNKCEGILGVVASGTENLMREIKHGVKYAKKGADEIDSRFGRDFLKLLGCNLKDVQEICNANGIADEKKIEDFFEECKPVRKLVNVKGVDKSVRIITDLRRLKRLVQKHIIQTTSL